jgi:hypothetical protein
MLCFTATRLALDQDGDLNCPSLSRIAPEQNPLRGAGLEIHD